MKSIPQQPRAPRPSGPAPDPIHADSSFARGRRETGCLPAARQVLLVILLAFNSARADVSEVGAIGLTVGDLDRAIEFYTRVLPFELVSPDTGHEPDLARLGGRPDTRTRTATLRLGREFITLTHWEGGAGRPVPADSRSFDHWFQHIAIIVRDMDAAYAHLRRHKVRHVSTAPQTLPDWNPNAGGIRAFYFRDPEDHVLEILWFPPGKGDPRWQQPATNLFLGIDHTAIVVSDTERSLAFYRDVLGMTVAGESENHGVEQERLNQVFGARLRITALRAPRGPGIEFLEYITPPGGRPLPPDARADDRIFWRTRLLDSTPANVVSRVESGGGRVLTPGGAPPATSWFLRDPDGHALQLDTGLNLAREHGKDSPGR